jgi:hypothetical protein
MSSKPLLLCCIVTYRRIHWLAATLILKNPHQTPSALSTATHRRIHRHVPTLILKNPHLIPADFLYLHIRGCIQNSPGMKRQPNTQLQTNAYGNCPRPPSNVQLCTQTQKTW